MVSQVEGFEILNKAFGRSRCDGTILRWYPNVTPSTRKRAYLFGYRFPFIGRNDQFGATVKASIGRAKATQHIYFQHALAGSGTSVTAELLQKAQPHALHGLSSSRQ